MTRTCSECGQPLSGRSVLAKTCSDKCRLKRSRRIKRANREAQQYADTQPEAAQAIRAVVQNDANGVIARVMRDQLEPVVREALTEDVLLAVRSMLGLTFRAVEQIEQDLESENDVIRQRAYALIMKYTIGHPALLQAKDTTEGGQIVVNFELPRPEPSDTPIDGEPPEAEELQVCDICHEEKPSSEFVAGSERCAGCVAEWKQRVLDEFS